jgi:hypothetical protein
MRKLEYTNMNVTPRYIVNLATGGSMQIRPALVTEVVDMKYQLSVKYGNSRIFLKERHKPFSKVVEECKALEARAEEAL